jgi:hypothetical protein
MKISIQWVLTPVIGLWKFGNPFGRWNPTPKMGAHLGVWVHSFTLSYIFESMKCDSWASFLAHTFASLYVGCEPKARVATHWCYYELWICLWIIKRYICHLIFLWKKNWNAHVNQWKFSEFFKPFFPPLMFVKLLQAIMAYSITLI